MGGVPVYDLRRTALHPQVLLHNHLHVQVKYLRVIWRKSSVSNPSGNCVELAELADGTVAVRNSREPQGPVLIYTRAEIAAFLEGVQRGEFDDLSG